MAKWVCGLEKVKEIDEKIAELICGNKLCPIRLYTVEAYHAKVRIASVTSIKDQHAKIWF